MAKPHSPDNKALARECRDVKIDRVYIGSCTGGKTEDFVAAARILQNNKVCVVVGWLEHLWHGVAWRARRQR